MFDAAGLAWRGDLPTRTPETAPFWDACNEDTFLLQQCRDCGKFQYHYRAHCSHCLSDQVADYPSAGQGTIWTYSTVFRNSTPTYQDWTPYIVGVVELEGGVKVFGNILGVDPERVRIGQPVRIAFSLASTGQKVPVFVVNS